MVVFAIIAVIVGMAIIRCTVKTRTAFWMLAIVTTVMSFVTAQKITAYGWSILITVMLVTVIIYLDEHVLA